MNAPRFHNALRILLSLDGYDLINAGVVDQNWGTPEASERDQMGAFLSDPAREALRMPDANFERLGALLESRQPAAKPDHASDTVDALTQAESFISGFGDDEMQEGVADILAGLRAAIPREQARPDLLPALKGAEEWLSGWASAEPYLTTIRAAIAAAEPPAPIATSRPGDQAAVYALETGVDYATALVHCNMD